MSKFSDYFTGVESEHDDAANSGPVKPTPTPTPKPGMVNVEDSDEKMLEDLAKGKR